LAQWDNPAICGVDAPNVEDCKVWLTGTAVARSPHMTALNGLRRDWVHHGSKEP